MKALNNQDVLSILSQVTTFQGITSKVTNETFTEKGIDSLMRTDIDGAIKYLNLAMQFILNKIRGITVNIPEMYSAIVEEYSMNMGGILQRIQVTKFLKPVSPAYTVELQDGDATPYPGIMRKPEVEDYFFTTNLNYQNTYTITDDFRIKQAFATEEGMWNLASVLADTFDSAYYVQKYETVREALSLAINSEKFPLKDTQKYTCKKIVKGDTEAAQEFMEMMENLGDVMKNITYTPQFNAASAQHYTPLSDYVLLVRGNKWNAVNNALKVIYHNDFKFPFKVVTVNDFGGLVATTDGTLATELKPVYSEKAGLGIQLGYNATGSIDDEIIPEFDSRIKYYDPNKDICAVLIQKGAIFTTEQNNYLVESYRNVRYRTTHVWASQPEVGIHYDSRYDLITISDTNEEASV